MDCQIEQMKNMAKLCQSKRLGNCNPTGLTDYYVLFSRRKLQRQWIVWIISEGGK